MLSFKNSFVFFGALALITGCDVTVINNPTPATNTDIIAPATSTVGTLASSFTVNSFNLAKPYATSDYVYGVADIHYSGSTPRDFVKVIATFKSSSGTILYKDTTSYLNNETTVDAESHYTNSFVSTTKPNAYYIFIEELTFSASTIATVEFEFKGDSFTPANTVSNVTLSGAASTSGTITTQYISNTGNETVDLGSCLFIYQNSSNVSYFFNFPKVYEKIGSAYVLSDTIDANTDGRLTSDILTPDFETGTLSIKKVLLNWDFVDETLDKKSIMSITDPSARLKAILDARNEAISNARQSGK